MTERFHLGNLALESHFFCFADRFLSIQVRSQRTPSREQKVESLHQAMAHDSFLLGGRVVCAQSCHLPAFRGCRIVESSPITYPVTRGCLGRPRRLGCWLC